MKLTMAQSCMKGDQIHSIKKKYIQKTNSGRETVVKVNTETWDWISTDQ